MRNLFGIDMDQFIATIGLILVVAFVSVLALNRAGRVRQMAVESRLTEISASLANHMIGSADRQAQIMADTSKIDDLTVQMVDLNAQVTELRKRLDQYVGVN